MSLKNRLPIALLAFLASIIPTSVVFAQTESEDTGGGIGLLLCCGVILVINIALLVWVWNDANNRGSNGIVWSIIVLIFGVLGLLLYFIARPQGQLIACPDCGKKKPITQAICPHCGRRVV